MVWSAPLGVFKPAHFGGWRASNSTHLLIHNFTPPSLFQYDTLSHTIMGRKNVFSKNVASFFLQDHVKTLVKAIHDQDMGAAALLLDAAQASDVWKGREITVSNVSSFSFSSHSD